MKPAAFTYHRPATVEEAARLLATEEDAKILAGGQSLLPIMNMRLAEPAHLIDITGIVEIRATREEPGAVLHGAATTHMMIEHGLVPDASNGLMPLAAAGIGYRAIRTRGTLGGSLAHSDSSAEWPTVLSALDATAVAYSIRGERRIPVRELLTGFFSTLLADDEIITAIAVPRLGADTRWGLHKLARKPGEFAESLAVVLRRPGGDEIWVGAARDTPIRLTGTEALIAGRDAADVAPGDIVESIGDHTDLDGHPRQLHAVAIVRALRASERETADVA